MVSRPPRETLSLVNDWQNQKDLVPEHLGETVGVAGKLFNACVALFKGLIRLRKANSVVKYDNVYDLYFGTIFFWGHGLGAEDGDLDEYLEGSPELRDVALGLLIMLVELLREGIMDCLEMYDRKWYLGIAESDIATLLEQARFIVPDEYVWNVASDHEASKVGFAQNESAWLAEMKTYLDCLCTLSSSIESPACTKVVDSEERSALTATQTRALNAHHGYNGLIRERFPKAEPKLVNQLAEANWERFIRVRREKLKNLEEEERSEDEKTGVTDPTIVMSKFQDSGLGPSELAQSIETKSMASFVSSRAEGSHARLPPLSQEARAGKAFTCDACSRLVVFKRTRLWKNHVFEDILPYVCIYQGCTHATIPFENRDLWTSHLGLDHGLAPSWSRQICPLCHETTEEGQHALSMHFGRHLEEIALAVVPNGPDDEGDDDGDGLQLDWHSADLSDEDNVNKEPLALVSYYCVCKRTDYDDTMLTCAKCSTLQHKTCYYGSLDVPGIHYCRDCAPRQPSTKNELPSSPRPSTSLDGSDSEYKPSLGSPPGNRRRRRILKSGESSNTHRRSTNVSSSHISKPSTERSGVSKPFPCILAPYSCTSAFASKNEWKRHIGTHHLRLGFWRCDLCPTTVDSPDSSTVYYNDFNRKDLFTQHLRRMHAAPVHPRRVQREYPVTEDNLPEHQKRCYTPIRSPPPRSSCLFCDRQFLESNGWEELMEHVGRHLEKDRKAGGAPTDTKDWQPDKELEQWLVVEGLIEDDRSGGWKLGDGKPKRGAEEDDE
ncbi:hypothetical protein BU16DRAFT_544278 [Lophium mytilinum]|uniref:Oxidoreductase acuF-like C2H2 type zinc-finger domain-containing protein n=1 Tax=Lophium mytilinum TaxID=390894 RepID=A0A6A6QCE2_9PEZI|nr:hypothetical protein BU16DRAFT_544278 [Lophium mytilinum]